MAVLISDRVLSQKVKLEDVGGNELHIFVLRDQSKGQGNKQM